MPAHRSSHSRTSFSSCGQLLCPMPVYLFGGAMGSGQPAQCEPAGTWAVEHSSSRSNKLQHPSGCAAAAGHAGTRGGANERSPSSHVELDVGAAQPLQHLLRGGRNHGGDQVVDRPVAHEERQRRVGRGHLAGRGGTGRGGGGRSGAPLVQQQRAPNNSFMLWREAASSRHNRTGLVAHHKRTSLSEGSSQVDRAMQPASGSGCVSTALYATWPPCGDAIRGS